MDSVITDLLKRAKEAGLSLRLDGDVLVMRGPKSAGMRWKDSCVSCMNTKGAYLGRANVLKSRTSSVLHANR